MQYFDFVPPLENEGFTFFPEIFLNNPLALYHATEARFLDVILRNGLRPSNLMRNEPDALASISYGRRPLDCFVHWMNVRDRRQDRNGIILALEFSDLSEILENSGTLISGPLRTQPTIPAICRIPESYRHI